MAGEGAKGRRGPLQLGSKDWDKLLGEGEGEGAEPLPLVVVPGKSPPAKVMDEEEADNQLVNDLRKLTDRELLQSADRIRKALPNLSSTLKDGGEKLKRSLRCYEDELKRRPLHPLRKSDDGGCKKLIEHHDRNCNGVSDDLWDQPLSSLSPSPSFSTCLSSKLDRKTDSTTIKVFDKELSTLNPCGQRKTQSQRPFSSSSRQKRGLSSKESPFQSLGSPLLNFDNVTLSNGYQKERRRSARLQASNSPKRIKETVVLVDEELEVEETGAQPNKLDQCKNARIYYPSRDDPVSVETICYSDMDCLAPQAYLSSTIMNFYIRYLQVEGLASKMTESESCNYHFFNTYFYEKLKEALGEKQDMENSFAKLRRWWKRIHIFEKAYVLIPIHENLHWSLVIICIPDVEDRSGPIILHLDSLGLHSSRSIFSNIKSFLIEEWKFLREREVPLDLPIADTVWENLSNRIDERIVQVPQQGNDYDCGLFVLFFMKRFMEEAPDRLKKKDLARFGRKWFNPEEASSLRQSIRSLLKEKFKNARDEKQLLDLRL